MLVICEDCAKKYNVDESRIKRKKARFTCKECGHIIIVEKPEVSESRSMSKDEIMDTVFDMASPEEQQNKNSSTSDDKGNTTNTFFILKIIIAILVVGGLIAYMYRLNP